MANHMTLSIDGQDVSGDGFTVELSRPSVPGLDDTGAYIEHLPGNRRWRVAFDSPQAWSLDAPALLTVNGKTFAGKIIANRPQYIAEGDIPKPVLPFNEAV